jgi:N-acetylmuramoyl-L-alanine amidase
MRLGACGAMRLAAACLAVALIEVRPAAAVDADGGLAGRDRFDTIVIDAGHGGDDLGAAGTTGLLEKDLVLAVAMRLAERLREQGLRVVLTRQRDAYVPLDQRTAAANAAGGDLFLSVHANAASSPKARGVETYFASLEASDDAAQRVAHRENEAFRETSGGGSGPVDSIGAILGDLIETEHLAESDEFARLAHRELSSRDPSPARGVKQAPFYVLMGVEMPACLVEIGFLTHPEEEHALASAQRQGELADALARAVREFGRRHDARRGFGPTAGGGGR